MMRSLSVMSFISTLALAPIFATAGNDGKAAEHGNESFVTVDFVTTYDNRVEVSVHQEEHACGWKHKRVYRLNKSSAGFEIHYTAIMSALMGQGKIKLYYNCVGDASLPTIAATRVKAN